MARRRTHTIDLSTTFVGTFYDVNAGVYVATRKDGTLTVGKMNTKGVSIRAGSVLPDAMPLASVHR